MSSKSIGNIQYNRGENLESFNLSHAEISIEEIDQNNLLYISATASHHEIHDKHEVYVEDLNFSILIACPQKKPIDTLHLVFSHIDPNHPNWEKTVYSNFYQYEHFIIIDGSILLEQIDQTYHIIIKGSVGENASSSKSQFTACFKANITSKINRAKNYFLSK